MLARMLSNALLVVIVFALVSLLFWFKLPNWLVILVPAALLFAWLSWQQQAHFVAQGQSGASSTIAAATNKVVSPQQVAKSSQMITSATSAMAMGAAEVSFYMDGLNNNIRQITAESAQISTVTTKLISTSAELSDNLQHISQNVQQTAESSSATDQRLQGGVNRLAELSQAVDLAAAQLQKLRTSADNIQQITEVIHSVADQTNLLALNAAIEAARAGEAGRGFAVVADEVRTLAGKTSTATQDIAKMLQEIRQQSSETGAQMDALVSLSNGAREELQAVAAGMKHINTEITAASGALSQIDQAGSEVLLAGNQLNDAVQKIHHGLHAIEEKGKNVAEQAIELSEETEGIYREMMELLDDSFFHPIYNEAHAAAQNIAKLLEQAISAGQLDEKALFSEQYQPIPNSNPQKYHTSYDRFTDQHFPAIQEPILQRHSHVLYAGAVDRQGYFPTHNRKFSQPLTGDYQTDLLQNRTKRLFNDRTGRRCGSSQTAMLLQTYKRDTGEILHDLSVPIMVKGRHWGGFRIGFKRL